MRTKLSIISLLLLLFAQGCRDHNTYMQERTFRQIKTISPNAEGMLIYYFDGDCSMCLAKVKAIEQFARRGHSEFTPVFIAKTTNPKGMRFNLAQLHITTPVYEEQNNEFERSITFNTVTQVDHKRVITTFNEEQIAL